MQEFKHEIPNFLGGLNHSVHEYNLQPNESQELKNVDISNGNLRTTKGYKRHISVQAETNGIKSLMVFYKTNTDGTVTGTILEAGNTTLKKWTGTAWTQVKTHTNGDYYFINYQKGDTEYMIFGNGIDQLQKFDGNTVNNLSASAPRVKCVGLHKERVWGAVDKANPNRIYYSADFDPENWNPTLEGAGQLDIPTWDGGVIIGLSTIFNDVVIFKTNNIFRIFGTYPGDYQVVQIHSTVGAIAPKSICQSSDLAFFMAREGIFIYDGVSTKPLMGDKLKPLLNTMAVDYVNKACGVVFDNKLYMAFPQQGHQSNNIVIEYDMLKQNFVVKEIPVNQFLEYSGKLLFVNNTGYVFEYGTGNKFDTANINAEYKTPTTDLGVKNAVKQVNTIYMTAWGEGQLKIEYVFDGKIKSTIIDLTATPKVIRKNIRNRGRQFYLRFSNVNGSSFEIQNPQLMMELDED